MQSIPCYRQATHVIGPVTKSVKLEPASASNTTSSGNASPKVSPSSEESIEIVHQQSPNGYSNFRLTRSNLDLLSFQFSFGVGLAVKGFQSTRYTQHVTLHITARERLNGVTYIADGGGGSLKSATPSEASSLKKHLVSSERRIPPYYIHRRVDSRCLRLIAWLTTERQDQRKTGNREMREKNRPF